MGPELNRSLVTRLVKYQRILRRLKSIGFVKVFSNNLGDAIGVTPAVVRKDFSLFSIVGNKRGGYDIDNLMEDIARVLGTQAEKEVILVGCGRIGQALMNYQEFAKEGIRIASAFDTNPELHSADAPIPIYPISKLRDIVQEKKIEIAIIAVPESSATQVFDDMIRAGIRGFLNFTSVELKCHGRCDKATCQHHCTVSTVNIGLELENLFYLIHTERT